MGPSGALRARGLAASRSINRDCWDSQMDGERVYFCQGIFYVLPALILWKVAADKRRVQWGLADPQRAPSRSSPAALLRCFSSANPLLLLPKGKPQIHGREGELQQHRRGFVLDCSEQQHRALSFATLHQRLVRASVLRGSRAVLAEESRCSPPSPGKCRGFSAESRTRAQSTDL